MVDESYLIGIMIGYFLYPGPNVKKYLLKPTKSGIKWYRTVSNVFLTPLSKQKRWYQVASHGFFVTSFQTKNVVLLMEEILHQLIW